MKIRITLSTSSPTLDPNSASPFYLLITARVLSSPRPQIPITFMAYLNAFESLLNQSIGNIKCTSLEESKGNFIEIWPRSCPNYGSSLEARDLRQIRPFVTIAPDHPLVVHHEIPRSKIIGAGLEKGEKYKVKLTSRALGTRWWAFGLMEDLDGLQLRRWHMEDEELHRDSVDEEVDEGKETTSQGPFTMGEDSDQLALVIERGEAEFCIA